MGYDYRCDICGCYLDPGEGTACDECREKIRKRSEETKRIQQTVQEGNGQQYEFVLGGTT